MGTSVPARGVMEHLRTLVKRCLPESGLRSDRSTAELPLFYNRSRAEVDSDAYLRKADRPRQALRDAASDAHRARTMLTNLARRYVDCATIIRPSRRGPPLASRGDGLPP
jgi:hypothetical protein